MRKIWHFGAVKSRWASLLTVLVCCLVIIQCSGFFFIPLSSTKVVLKLSRTSPCLVSCLPSYFKAVISFGFPLEGSKCFCWFSLLFDLVFFLSFKDQTKSAMLLFPSGFYQDKIMNKLGKKLLFFCCGALVVSTEGHSSLWKEGGVYRLSIQMSAVLVCTSGGSGCGYSIFFSAAAV